MAEALRESLSMGLSPMGWTSKSSAAPTGFSPEQIWRITTSPSVTTFDLFMSQFAYARVDGRYASSASEVMTVMGATSYAHAGATYSKFDR